MSPAHMLNSQDLLFINSKHPVVKKAAVRIRLKLGGIGTYLGFLLKMPSSDAM